MNPRDKNLLEALRSAGEARVSGLDEPAPKAGPPKAPTPAAPPSPSGGASGPAVQVASRSPTSSLPGDVAPPATDGPRAAAPPTRAVPALLVWAAALGLAFVLGVVVGRQTRSDEGAEEGAFAAERLDLDPNIPARSARRDPIRRGPSSTQAPESTSTPAENPPRSALFDTKNQYTLVIANYGKTRDDFAWATHDHLLESGVSVFPPVVRNEDILVLAGATATVAELGDLQEEVHGLAGWNGDDSAYADAYVARIDALIKR